MWERSRIGTTNWEPVFESNVSDQVVIEWNWRVKMRLADPTVYNRMFRYRYRFCV
jgi:hypothetical protein